MNLKTITLLSCFIFCNLSFSTSTSKDDLAKLNKQLKSLQSARINCKGNTTCLEKVSKKINSDVIEKSKKIKSVLGKYLTFLASAERLQISLDIFSKKKDIKKLNSAMERYQKKHAPFASENQDDRCDEFRNERSARLKVFNMNSNDCMKMYSIIDSIKTISEEIERTIYHKATPNKTFFEIEEYLRKYGVYDDGKIESTYAIEAFKDYFDLYTLDGDPKSISNFLDEDFGQVGLKRKLYDKLDESGYIDRALNKAGDSQRGLLKKKISDKEIIGIINGDAPKASAFLGLQRLIQPLIISGNISEAIRIVKKYEGKFCPQNEKKELYKESCTEVNSLLTTLKSINKKGSKEVNVLDGDFNTYSPYENIRFVFSRDNNYLAVIPTHISISSYPIYKLGNKSTEYWELHKEVNTEIKSDLTYQFELNHITNASEENIAPILKRDILKQSNDFKDGFEKDFYIYSPKGGASRERIAFFVSTSAFGRELRDEKASEYNSPWFIDKNLQFQESNNGELYHGKTTGNNNTDLYYSIYNHKKDSWKTPVHLGNVINSRFSERSPFYDGQFLYFASEGHGGLGKYDIFKIELPLSTLKPKGQLINVYDVNSPEDELYYYAIKGKNGDTELSEYISSNRLDGKFKIFKIGEKNSRAVKVDISDVVLHENSSKSSRVSAILSKPVSQDTYLPVMIDSAVVDAASLNNDYIIEGLVDGKILIPAGQNSASFSIKVLQDSEDEKNELVKFDISGTSATFNIINTERIKHNGLAIKRKCKHVEQNPGVPSKNEVKVEATIFEVGSGIPLENASVELWFRDKGKKVSLDEKFTNSKGQITFNIPAGVQMGYRIKKESGNDITHYELNDDIDVCTKNAFGFIVEELEIPIPTIFERKSLKVPFFFHYNADEVKNQVNNLSEIQEGIRLFASDFKEGSSLLKFVVIAFADTTGNEIQNCRLSARRAKRVKDQLIEWGIPENKISHFGYGETNDFDSQLEQLNNGTLQVAFPKILTGPEGSTQEMKKIYQLNRRAEILFSYNILTEKDRLGEYAGKSNCEN